MVSPLCLHSRPLSYTLSICGSIPKIVFLKRAGKEFKVTKKSVVKEGDINVKCAQPSIGICA
jgi:hypothetical protein